MTSESATWYSLAWFSNTIGAVTVDSIGLRPRYALPAKRHSCPFQLRFFQNWLCRGGFRINWQREEVDGAWFSWLLRFLRRHQRRNHNLDWWWFGCRWNLVLLHQQQNATQRQDSCNYGGSDASPKRITATNPCGRNLRIFLAHEKAPCR